MAKQNTTTALAKLAQLHKDFQQAELVKLEEALKPFAARQQTRTVSPRKMVMTGLAVAVVVVIAITAFNILQSILLPSRLLGRYEQAKLEGDFETATESALSYIDEVPDDWELIANHAYFLLQHGDLKDARILYSKLLNNSPLADDLEIEFGGAVSQLNSRTTRKKMGELIVILDKFIPALAARALLEPRDNFEDAQANIDKAISELAKLDQRGDTYSRYQNLLALFIVNSCRVNHESYAGSIGVSFEFFPTPLIEDDLLLFGLDTETPISFCSVVPQAFDDVVEYSPDLDAMLYAIKAFNEMRGESYGEAARSASLSVSREQTTVGAYLSGILSAREGRFDEAELAMLRTGAVKHPRIVNNLAVAKILAGKKNWEDASALIEEAVKARGSNTQALNNLAVMQMLNKRFGPAKTSLENALKLNQSYLSALYNLAVTQLQLEEFEQSTDNFFTVVGQGQFFPGADYFFARALFANGDVDRALATYNVASNTAGFGVFARIKLGDYYADEGATETALEFYSGAFRENPSNYESALKSVLMLAKISRFEDALSQLELVESQFEELAAANNNSYLRLLFAIKGEIYATVNYDEAEEILAKALELATGDRDLYPQVVATYTDELLKRDKVREALDLTRTALPTDPSSTQLLLARTKALIDSNDLDQALDLADEAASNDPENSAIKLIRARILVKDQRLDEAATLYQEIYELNPADIAPLEEAITALERFEGQEDTIAILNEKIERAQFTSPGIIGSAGQGQAVAKKVLSEEEIEAIKNEIVKTSDLLKTEQIEKFSGHLYRGFLYNQVGAVNEAIADYQDAIANIAEAPPGDAFQPYQRLTEIYLRLGSYEDALDSVNGAIASNPSEDLRNSMTLTRAGILEKLGKFDDAIAEYSEIIKLFPNHLPPYLRRCLLYLEKREAEQAVKDCSTVIKIDPKNLEAYTGRHRAYGILGDTVKASKDSRIISTLQKELEQSGG